MPLDPPKFQNMREVIVRATRELVVPYPSVRLPRWKRFNDIVGGFRMKEYSILCAPTGSGKTEFLANLSAQLIESNVKHFVMSVETGETDFCKRVMGVIAGQDLNHGDAIEHHKIASIYAEHEKLLSGNALDLALYDNRLPVEQLMYDIEYMHEFHGSQVVFLDNLNFFMEPTDKQLLEMDRVTHELIMFCKRVDVHIVMVMHPKKTEAARVESEFDIKGSSTAVQEAHNIFLLNRPRKEDIGALKYSDRELKIAKLRRRGRNTGKILVFGYDNNRYVEKGIYDPTGSV